MNTFCQHAIVTHDLLSCLEMGGPKLVMDVITEDETGSTINYSTALPTNTGTKQGWVQMTRHTKSATVDLRTGRGH